MANWYHVRQMVDLALVEAARAGATQHARPSAMAQAFEQALQPLFVGTTPPAGPSKQARNTRLAQALGQRSHAMHHAPPWQIRILRPNTRDYTQFADPNLAIARTSGFAAIRNDYQYEQQQRRPGRTATSVFSANTLELRLVYPHSPFVPGVARLLARLQAPSDAYAQQALAAGLLPMVREIQLDMASHPVAWPSLADGRVIQGDGANYPGPSATNTPCLGLWCSAPPAPPVQTPSVAAPDPGISAPTIPAPESAFDPQDSDWDTAEDGLDNDPTCS